MVLDYSEKKSRDGLERKPLQKNRPRKSSSATVALLSVAAVALIFGAGVGTGWFLHKATHTAPPAAVAQAPKKVEPAQAPPQPPAPDAPLTFYKTLPAGGKGVMGSGLNLKKPEPQGNAPHAAGAPAAPAAAPAAPAAPSAPAAAAPAAEKPAEQKQGAAAQYLVQVASYRNKTEADAAQAKLSAKGIAAYVVESKVTDKGTWYRLRVGKHLSKGEAEELAGKAGKGAVVIQE